MTAFQTKASDTQDTFASGMTRDSNEGKARFDLLLPEALPYDEQMLTRFAMLMARGAVNHGDRNWEQANGTEDLGRFKESLHRHVMQYLCGDRSEDHAASILYNVMGAEYVRYQLDN